MGDQTLDLANLRCLNAPNHSAMLRATDFGRTHEDYLNSTTLGLTDRQRVKDVENRTWSTRYRGPILIHASRTINRISDDEFQARFGMSLPRRVAARWDRRDR
jgi:hypothetical protein